MSNHWLCKLQQQGFRGSELAGLLVPYPPLPTQHKIAAILSAYDDLIENNARRIAILEEMAQSLYKEWFVHFRFPGHEKISMVESELGMNTGGMGGEEVGGYLLDYDGTIATFTVL